MIKIEPIVGDQALEIIERLKKTAAEKVGDVLDSFGCSIKGFFDVICREEATQEVAWEAHQANLLTDFGRRSWWTWGITPGGIFTSGVAETPMTTRYGLTEGAGTAQMQTNVAPTTDWGALTKYWSTTFGTPASNRPIAIVGLMSNWGDVSMGRGAQNIVCYSLINPQKMQTTSQTLEISYRLTLQAGV